MDVPNTGAVFAIGKSYLAENTQSYFYIKNDPIKRLVAGPYQSAVICESGRLFVWGENHFGQLGVGGSSIKHAGSSTKNGSASNASGSSSSNSNVPASNINNKNRNHLIVDIVTKPTCVKSLKTLGLKIVDIAFGDNWAITLTHSNELFFCGRSIFHDDRNNFVETVVAGNKCFIARRPFRLGEFDNCLSNSEDEEHFVSVMAGSNHFALMTSFGRLIAWGSNANHQLAQVDGGGDYGPQEIILDKPVQQFACGPECTLALTESGNLYLTGKLKEFVFSEFTELQKNLCPSQQIIFMHISKASEIYILTNSGSIYRSHEEVRKKTLIFQRFYDYDSEENGPIWKLLRGSSFYTVLTKSNKFYTTHSESGHHMRTFREISKFKNLRLIDMAVGNQHILVHGLPRCTITMGSAGEHRYMSRAFVMPDKNANLRQRSSHQIAIKGDTLGRMPEEPEGESKKEHVDKDEKETQKPNTSGHKAAVVMNINIEEVKTNDLTKDKDMLLEDNDTNKEKDNHNEDEETNLKTGEETVKETEPEPDTKSKIINKIIEDGKNNNTTKSEAPTESLKSDKSALSTELDEQALSINEEASIEKVPRPHTPFPDSNGSGSSTPQTAKAIRNCSYEAAMEHDAIGNTTPALHVSLEDISENSSAKKGQNALNAYLKTSTPPYEEDDELTVEIQTFTDELHQTVNEIRFINNGVDVTPKVATTMSADSLSIGSGLSEVTEEPGKKGKGLVQKVVKEMDKIAKESAELRKTAQAGIQYKADTMGKEINKKFEQSVESTKSAAHKLATGMDNIIDITGENIKDATINLDQTMDTTNNKTTDAASDAKQSIGKTMTAVANDTKLAVSSGASQISNEMQNAQENLSILSSGKTSNKSDPDERDGSGTYASESSFKAGMKAQTIEEDERTTASVSPTHTLSGNPFDNGSPRGKRNRFEVHLVDETNIPHLSGKQELQQVKKRSKGKLRRFFSDLRSKNRGMSCRNQKDVHVVDDPPSYTPVEEFSQGHGQINNNDSTTKVCAIL